MRIKLVISYDGTDFRGFMAQPGLRTVQGTLTEAVRRVSGEEIETFGASRTDSGAHARGQVVQFDYYGAIPAHKWKRILNWVLPCDLSVKSSEQVDDRFECRFGAMDRFYRYRILVGDRDPLRERYAHFYGRPVELASMQSAAALIKGQHDFRAFTEELEPTVLNTVRELRQITVKQVRDEVWVDVVGTAFLRGMMRRISGALLEVGRNYRPIEEVSMLLSPQEWNDIQWPVVLPAKGLCLMRVRYPRRLVDHRLKSRISPP